MEIQELLKYFSSHPKLPELLSEIENKDNKGLHVKGLSGSASAFIISALFRQSNKNFICLLNDKEEAAYAHNDFCSILNNEEDSLFFPSSYKRQIHHESLDTTSIVLRTEVLNKLSSTKKNRIIVSYPGAITEKVLSREKLEENTLQLKVGEEIGIEFITEVLNDYHFERSDFVFEPGQFSVRGSIVDIFSFSSDVPFRIDFFGDEVETIRSFDIESQLSLDHFKKISIVPNIQDERISKNQYSFFDFIPDDTVIITNDLPFFKDRIDRLVIEAKHKYEEDETEEKGIEPSGFLLTGKEILKKLEDFFVLEIGLH
ncbi:MAG: transcription-repair coupling factor, partial [Bacteroidota bacterium]|nr:transcription-repair coupling factor [Bacteroidota bacterium]